MSEKTFREGVRKEAEEEGLSGDKLANFVDMVESGAARLSAIFQEQKVDKEAALGKEASALAQHIARRKVEDEDLRKSASQERLIDPRGQNPQVDLEGKNGLIKKMAMALQVDGTQDFTRDGMWPILFGALRQG